MASERDRKSDCTEGGDTARAESIEAIKRLFIAATGDQRSIRSAVATVLFDNAVEALAPEDGLTRMELADRVNDLLEEWQMAPAGEDLINTSLHRLGNRLPGFVETQLPLLGVTDIQGPTRNQRMDRVERVWLAIAYAPPAEDALGLVGRTIEDGLRSSGGADRLADYERALAAGAPYTIYEAHETHGHSPSRKRMLILSVSFLLTAGGLLAHPTTRKWIMGGLGKAEAWIMPPAPTKPSGNTVDVRPDPTYNIFNLRVKTRETLAFVGVTSAFTDGRCTQGKAEVWLHLATLPALKELVLLRNDEIYRRYANFAGGVFELTDTDVQPDRWYVYKLAHFDATSNEYFTSRPLNIGAPKCAADNRQPVGLSVSVEPQHGVAPLTVKCSVTAKDPDGDPLKYSWMFMEPGDFVTKPGASTEHTFRYGGKWVAQAYADDGRDEPHMVASVDVMVEGPKAPIGTPAEWVHRDGFGEVTPTTGPPGTPFRLRVLPQRSERARAVQYRFRLGYCAPGKPEPPPTFPCMTPPQSSPEYVHAYKDVGQYEVEAEITFDNGEMEVRRIAVVDVRVP